MKSYLLHGLVNITPDTLVTRNQAQIREFLAEHQDIILKSH